MITFLRTSGLGSAGRRPGVARLLVQPDLNVDGTSYRLSSRFQPSHGECIHSDFILAGLTLFKVCNVRQGDFCNVS